MRFFFFGASSISTKSGIKLISKHLIWDIMSFFDFSEFFLAFVSLNKSNNNVSKVPCHFDPSPEVKEFCPIFFVQKLEYYNALNMIHPNILCFVKGPQRGFYIWCFLSIIIRFPKVDMFPGTISPSFCPNSIILKQNSRWSPFS